MSDDLQQLLKQASCLNEEQRQRLMKKWCTYWSDDGKTFSQRWWALLDDLREIASKAGKRYELLSSLHEINMICDDFVTSEDFPIEPFGLSEGLRCATSALILKDDISTELFDILFAPWRSNSYQLIEYV